MKKNVGFIALDSSLSRWLSDQLRTTAPHTPAAQELREALGDLMDGTVDSLMLELGAEQPLTAADDILCCGGLSIDPYCNYGTPDTEWKDFARFRLLHHDINPEMVNNR